MKNLTLSDFMYDLPEELVAQTPLPHRDEARLLVYQSPASFLDTRVKDLPEILPEGSLLIVNNSRVIPSRLIGKLPSGGKAEIFLLERVAGCSTNTWKALGRPLKKFRDGLTITFDGGCSAELGHILPGDGQVTPFKVTFDREEPAFSNWLQEYGYIPLPPYISRHQPETAKSSADAQTYQTVYAQPAGSVAAPTAGLHFTDSLLQHLRSRGIRLATVTLHVGAGTFLPVKSENLDEHPMHEESFTVPMQTLHAMQDARKDGRKIIAVGTTTLRSLQSLYLQAGDESRVLEWGDRLLRTQLFLRPRTRTERLRPWAIDALMTNFHQPGSTLFMLIASLLGLDEAQSLYRHAIMQRYRFFSYGDSSLLWLP